jgi:hypothetical protein
MCALIFSTFLSEKILILRRNERDMIKNVHWSLRKASFILVRFIMEHELSRKIFRKNSNIKFHADRRTDRHDEANIDIPVST